MLRYQRRYTIALNQLTNGDWYAGIPALNLWASSTDKTLAKRQLRTKLRRATKVIESGKAMLADSDAVDDNLWWELRIYAPEPVQT